MTADTSGPRWVLTLYVNGASPRSADAIVSARRICDEDLAGRADLTVVNAADHPALVRRDQIVALPTLVKHAPEPLRHLIGNLTDLALVRDGLDLGPEQPSADQPGPDQPSVSPSPTEPESPDETSRRAQASLRREVARLRRQIVDLQQALTAIRGGGVDAVVVGPEQEHVYSLSSADRPYRVIVERMGEGAATVSERGVILFANPRLASFLGVDRDSMIGRDITDYFDEDQQGALSSLLETDATESHRAQLAITTPDGAEVPALVAVTSLDLEGGSVRCLVFTDQTMPKRLEQQAAEETAQGTRLRVAREVNDNIVQGLVTAEMLLDLEQYGEARAAIARTSKQARRWIGELAVENELRPGTAVRGTAVRSEPDPGTT